MCLFFFFCSDTNEVLCSFITEYSEPMQRKFWICTVTQSIDSEQYVFGSTLNSTIESVHFQNNKKVEFLPREIGKKSSSLRIIDANGCGLTVVRDFYFKNLKNLRSLFLDHNQIKTIEPSAFADLARMIELNLHNNLIETLDEKLFVTTPQLSLIYLNHNKIKFLSPSTFNVPRLWAIHLGSNVCINDLYMESHDIEQMKLDLKANCTHT